MNKEKILITISTITTIACASIVVWIKFGLVNMLFVAMPSTVITIIIILLIRHHLWKAPFFKYVFGNYPNLNGKWKVKRQIHGDAEVYDAIIAIKQNWDNIEVFYEEGSIKSFSRLSRLIKEDSTFRLEYMWDDDFRQGDDHRVVVKGITSVRYVDINKLTGRYWSNSEQNPKHGTLEFERIHLSPPKKVKQKHKNKGEQ